MNYDPGAGVAGVLHNTGHDRRRWPCWDCNETGVDPRLNQPCHCPVGAEVQAELDEEAAMSWADVCRGCQRPIPHDGDPLWLDCLSCPHCGHHEHGARQKQLGRPCRTQKEAVTP